METLLAEAQDRNLQNMFRSSEDFAVSKFLNYCFLFCFQSVPVYEGILKILCLCIMKLT